MVQAEQQYFFFLLTAFTDRVHLLLPVVVINLNLYLLSIIFQEIPFKYNASC